MSSIKSPQGKSGFSFMSPKTNTSIKFNEQPKQSGAPPTPKKSGLTAYAKKGREPLPVGFADQLLECEMQFQLDEVSIETVNKLTELYSIGMVYYEPETTNKYKYQYFANKLQELMLRPAAKEAMLKSMSSNQSPEEDKELRRMRLETQISRVDSEKEAFTLVKSHEHKEKEITRVLEGDLSSQKDRMKKRLAERKVRSQSRPQSVTYSEDNASSTEEALQELEKELEALPSLNKRDLQHIEEVDEARYTTPPRRRSKNGVMIFFQRKSIKPLEPLEPLETRPEKGLARRQSFNVEQVTTAIVPKRAGRASSFGNKGGRMSLDVLGLKKKEDIVQEQKETDSSSSDDESITMAEVRPPVVVQKEVPSQAVETEQVKQETVPEEKVAEKVAEEQVQESKTVEVENVAQGESIPEPVELEVSPEKNETQQVTEEPEKKTEQEQAQVQQEEVQSEPVAVAVTEEVQAEQVEAPKEEEQKEENVAAVTRERSESEMADEARQAALKKIEEEQSVLLEEFIQKQEAQKEEVKSKTEAKYKQKRLAMEEDMEEDEKGGMMWQKVLAKMEKDKEEEVQKGLEKLGAEHSEELESYKKKLQQQRMFKLAQLSE